MDFTDVALTALQVVSPVLVAALTWAAAKLASFIRSKVDNEYLRGVAPLRSCNGESERPLSLEKWPFKSRVCGGRGFSAVFA